MVLVFDTALLIQPGGVHDGTPAGIAVIDTGHLEREFFEMSIRGHGIAGLEL